MRLFPDPRSESEWGEAIAFWEELLRPTADSFGWKWPWFTRQPDDGANIFSAWNPNVGRGFTLHQVGPDTTVFDAFYDTFDEERARIAYLVLRTDGSVRNISIISRLFDLWAGTDIAAEEITAIVAATLAGDRAALVDSPAK